KQAKAFALGDAVGNRNLSAAMRCLSEELWEMKLDRKRSALGLLYGLISKIRTLIMVKEMQRKGWLRMERQFFRFKQQLEQVPESAMPADPKFNPLKLNPYVLFRALPQSSNYATNELVSAMQILYEANMKLISSSLDDGQVLQQSIVSIITKNTA
ncbi:DNA polymerase III subunit delta, partial [Verrucomicrobia bacterium]|nr:DNA polymerase III subunit delta [Verrucomicrobiota bacterium]